MKALVLYPHPPEPDGVSMQGHYLIKGLKENGVDVLPCDRENGIQKEFYYKSFKPDVVIGVGFWADSPGLIFDPMEYGMTPVPWFNADGWVANYQDTLNKLPLLVTTSNWVKSTYARDGVAGNNVQVCPIGFDPEVFKPIPRSDPRVKKIREMLDIQEDEKMILTIGGDATSKGSQEMMRALKKIDATYPKWKYVLKVWDSFSAEDHGKEERALMEELGIADRVTHLMGKFSPEFMSILINACDIYAAPSRLEGFGMIQLEAQACGKPVISINVGGPKDTIVHNKTGFLVDVEHEIKLDREWVYPWMGFDAQKQIEFPIPKTFAYRANIDQLAEYTLKLLEDDNLRNEMGRAGAKHAIENFHYKVTAKRMIDLIEEHVLQNKTTSSDS
ncbi:MAG: glycosyltransferase family 4 protein [Nanoarchaeota archaeon]|nr:glycosyltransferase family 4 protein [Nanoarchaeota archaeon]